MLIGMQRPDATQVAGFHAWKKLGRSVKKGEKGIAILAPVVRRKPESDDDASKSDESETNETKTRPLVGCKVVHVFDVSQTKGKPLPGIDQVTGDPGHYFTRLRDFVGELGIELKTEPISGGADGVSRGGAITLRPGMTSGKAFGVLAHETAHEILHRTPRRNETTKTIRETEAEAVRPLASKPEPQQATTFKSTMETATHCGSRWVIYANARHASLVRSCRTNRTQPDWFIRTIDRPAVASSLVAARVRES